MVMMKTGRVKLPLFGHGMQSFAGNITPDPEVIGSFAAQTVMGHDNVEYALFTVEDPENGEYPSSWAGTYRISVSVLKSGCSVLGRPGEYYPDIFEMGKGG